MFSIKICLAYAWQDRCDDNRSESCRNVEKIGVEIGGAFNEIIIFEQDIGKIEDC